MYPGPKKYKLLQVAKLLDSLDSSLYLCRRKDRSFEVLKKRRHTRVRFRMLNEMSSSIRIQMYHPCAQLLREISR